MPVDVADILSSIRVVVTEDVIKVVVDEDDDLKVNIVENDISVKVGVIARPLGLSYPIATKTADYTLTVNDATLLCSASIVNLTMTLPPVSTTVRSVYNIKKIDDTAYTIIIDGYDSETIDGDTTVTIIDQYECITVQSNGSGWHII